MNTKKINQKSPRQEKQLKQKPKKQGQLVKLHENRQPHEQECPETRMTD
jgi:hypothetical protein